MNIRTATKADIPALAKLFNNSVRQIAPQKYSAEQVRAWAASISDLESFTKTILNSTIFIAETDLWILGFGGIDKSGYLNYLYVRGDYNRQGIGSQLLTKIVTHAESNKVTRLHSHASEFSKPLFEKFDFRIYQEEDISRNGIMFHRYLMEKIL